MEIKQLSQFVTEAGRGRPRKDANKDVNKEKEQEKPELKDVKGLDAEENDSMGVYEFEPPTDDDLLEDIDPENISDNETEIAMALASEKPFFVQGEAGWGKTSVIKKMAHKFGYTVCIVYLDKCDITDLGGMPVNAVDKEGRGYTRYNMPAWAHVIATNKNTKFLLFFDEMNQAQPDVMNALMPIIKEGVVCGHKLKNTIRCGAGNLEEENRGGVHKMSAPLLSRFGGIIRWQSGDWASAFRHLRKKYSAYDGAEELFDAVQPKCDLFKNPRDIDDFIIDTVFNLKKNISKAKFIKPKFYLNRLQRIAKDNLSQSGEDDLSELAESCYDFVQGNLAGSSDDDRGKNILMIPDHVVEAIKQGIELGYMPGDAQGEEFGISQENVRKLPINKEIGNKESLEKLIDMLEADGIKYKYKTDKEFKNAGYLDPCDPSMDFMLTKKTQATKKPEPVKKRKTIREYATKK